MRIYGLRGLEKGAQIQNHPFQSFQAYSFSSSHSLVAVQSCYTSSLYTHFFFPTNSPPRSPKMLCTPLLTLLATLSLTSARVLYTRQTAQAANSQPFTGALGGIAATPITVSGVAGRPFAVKADTFVNIGAALQRSCDQQFNACANVANAGGAAFSTQECSAQKSKCSYAWMIREGVALTCMVAECDAAS
jgi:hypothetical protein